MKVILKERVKGLGDIGDIKEVADGYARNYLIPMGFAVRADDKSAKGFLNQIEALKRKREKELEELKKLAQELESVTVKVRVKVGEDDKLFGSVTTKDIAEALKDLGYAVDRRDIVLDEPIKSLGTYEVDVKLGENIKARIRVVVEKNE